MTTLREAAQQALEALEFLSLDFFMLDPISPGREAGNKAMAALRTALAESNPKPLAEWQINDLMADIDPEDVCSWSFRQGVYAAEKHHGIKP